LAAGFRRRHLSDPAAVAAWSAGRDRRGRLDILVNAGITRDGLLVRMKDDDWDRCPDVNLEATSAVPAAVRG
jgi:3-oxoacyl-[acyl-carrier protein] reductase